MKCFRITKCTEGGEGISTMSNTKINILKEKNFNDETLRRKIYMSTVSNTEYGIESEWNT